MDPREYLKKHHLLTYIEDLTGIVIENRCSSKTFPKIHPIVLIQEYFHRVLTGLHVYQREYSYVSSTPYNRACLIRTIWQCYHSGLTSKSCSTMSCSEYYQLVQVLCHDFPSKFTDTALRLFSGSGKADVSFCDFMYVIQVLFYYEHFLFDCERLFERYNHPTGNQTPGTINRIKGVVVLPRPIDESDMPIAEQIDVNHTPSIDSVVTLDEAILMLYKDRECSSIGGVVPPMAAIRETLQLLKLTADESENFNNFLTVLCDNEQVNSDIGVLPPKDLFNETIPPIIGQPI